MGSTPKGEWTITIVERSIIIEATPEEVEGIHNDIDRLPQWYVGVEEAIGDGVYPEAGGKVKLIYKVAGITFEMTNTCLEYEHARYGR